MNGKTVIRALLVGHSPLTARINPTQAPSRISTETLGAGVVLPAIRIWKVSSVEGDAIKPGGTRHVRQRIQVDVIAKTTKELDEIMTLVRRAAADKLTTAAGLTNVSVVPAGEGPEGFDDEQSARSTSQDFSVTYNEPT